jgi:lysophospholipase L1-like esterase
LALLGSLLITLGCAANPPASGTGGSGGQTTGAGGQTTGAGGDTTGNGGGGAGGTAGIDAAHEARTTTLRITLLGDSTTSDGCFRAYLWQMLQQAGLTQFDFIGTRSGNPGCTVTGFDQDNEGHGGYIVSDVLKATSTGRPGGADASDPYVSSAQDLVTWFDGHPTDLVLMNFGTNDVSNNISASTITMAFSAILAKLRANNPNVQMMVAQIPPINWQYCVASVCGPRVAALNSAAVTWAQQNSTAQSPVSAVDLFTGYDDATDTVDGVHANNSGSMKIATKWFNAISPLF